MNLTTNPPIESLLALDALCAVATARHAPIVSRYRRLFGAKTAQHLDDLYFRILRRLEVKQLIECGAHEGSASLRFVSEQKGSALAIEANPYIFKAKTAALTNYGVSALNFALSKSNGKVSLHVPVGKVGTSTKGSLLSRVGELTESVDCEARTLDSIILERGFQHMSIGLWIDVEGAAMQVLQGADDILHSGKCKVIKIEVETHSFWQDQNRASEVHAFLRNRGYIPIARDCEYYNQYNLVYVYGDCINEVEADAFLFWQQLSKVRLSLFERIMPVDLHKNGLRLGAFHRLRRALSG